jgi:hypothetical protein
MPKPKLPMDDEFGIDIYGDTDTDQASESSFKQDEEGGMKGDDFDAVNGHTGERSAERHEDLLNDQESDSSGNGNRGNASRLPEYRYFWTWTCHNCIGTDGVAQSTGMGVGMNPKCLECSHTRCLDCILARHRERI